MQTKAINISRQLYQYHAKCLSVTTSCVTFCVHILKTLIRKQVFLTNEIFYINELYTAVFKNIYREKNRVLTMSFLGHFQLLVFLYALLLLSAESRKPQVFHDTESSDDGAEGTRWAVLVAGSNEYENYRHQVSCFFLL